MKIYKDLISSDEVLSDAFPFDVIADGTVYKVKAKLTTETTTVDDALIGGNASAEGVDAGEAADGSSQSGINVVLIHRLTEFGYKDKKQFQNALKAYMKKVKEILVEKGTSDEELKKFQDGITAYAKSTIMPNFKEYQFFFGENSALRGFDCMPILVEWDGETPYLYYFKHGLEEEKC